MPIFNVFCLFSIKRPSQNDPFLSRQYFSWRHNFYLKLCVWRNFLKNQFSLGFMWAYFATWIIKMAILTDLIQIFECLPVLLSRILILCPLTLCQKAIPPSFLSVLFFLFWIRVGLLGFLRVFICLYFGGFLNLLVLEEIFTILYLGNLINVFKISANLSIHSIVSLYWCLKSFILKIFGKVQKVVCSLPQSKIFYRTVSIICARLFLFKNVKEREWFILTVVYSTPSALKMQGLSNCQSYHSTLSKR